MPRFSHDNKKSDSPPVIPLWEQQARQWASVRPPLRPSACDLVFAQNEIDRQESLGGPMNAPMNALILGVTPELLDLRWPAEANVLAIDLSGSMIRGLWRKRPNERHRHWPAQGDWRRLPVADGSIDLALGDGCFGLMPSNQQELVHSLHRSLKPRGTWLVRVFLRPDPPESPAHVWDELIAGRIGNFHVFKFRLLSALAARDGSVPVVLAWQAVNKWAPSLDDLAKRLGWPIEEVKTVEAYRGQSAAYWLPTIQQFRDVMRSHFDEVSCHVPNYETGDRYPTFVFRSR
jgi:SAM-dependent methyltransferase